MRLHYLRNNLTWIIWLFLYFAVNIILFVEAAIKYKSKVSLVSRPLLFRSAGCITSHRPNYCNPRSCMRRGLIIVLSLYRLCMYMIHIFQGPAVSIARGCGACLNFNPTFVIVLMFRHVLSWVRSTRIYFLFPLDNIIKFHKLVGWMIFFLAWVHTFAHIANFSKNY